MADDSLLDRQLVDDPASIAARSAAGLHEGFTSADSAHYPTIETTTAMSPITDAEAAYSRLFIMSDAASPSGERVISRVDLQQQQQTYGDSYQHQQQQRVTPREEALEGSGQFLNATVNIVNVSATSPPSSQQTGINCNSYGLAGQQRPAFLSTSLRQNSLHYGVSVAGGTNAIFSRSSSGSSGGIAHHQRVSVGFVGGRGPRSRSSSMHSQASSSMCFERDDAVRYDGSNQHPPPHQRPLQQKTLLHQETVSVGGTMSPHESIPSPSPPSHHAAAIAFGGLSPMAAMMAARRRPSSNVANLSFASPG